MSKKKKMQKIDLENFFIYSGDDSNSGDEENADEPIVPGDHKLFVRKEKKGRAGKVVSIVEGFDGSEAQFEELAKEIKQHCGSGGAVKGDQIIIQGEKTEQIVRFLTNRGFVAKKTTM